MSTEERKNKPFQKLSNVTLKHFDTKLVSDIFKFLEYVFTLIIVDKHIKSGWAPLFPPPY